MSERLRDRCLGRWRGLLPALGVDVRHLTGRHGPCPVCGGKDRFRFDDKGGAGTWFCSQCGAGDGIKLVMAVRGLDFAGAAHLIEGIVGKVQQDASRTERTDEAKRKDLNRLWRASEPVTAHTAAGLYLTARTGLVAYPACLRASASAYYDRERSFPAMIAMVRGANGDPVTLHRTFLTADGRKAPVEKAKKLMPGRIPPGSAVRLYEPTDELGIAEGIETALSAAALFRVPCWAAVDAGHLEAWVPPAGVRSVAVFADNDASFVGQAAAFRLAARLRVAGLAVRVEIPPAPDTDWNDVHSEQLRETAA